MRFHTITRLARAALAAALIGFAAALAAGSAAGQSTGERRDEVLWNSIRSSGYVELFEFFLEQFPASRHAPRARIMIAVLNGEIPAVVPKTATLAEQAVAAQARGAALASSLDPRNLDIAAFQQGLRERGCNGGPADGIWGERTAGAAQRFVDARGLDIDPSRPGVALFGAVLETEGDVCGEL